ncbi:hypothetical protein [Polluticoccus soli]|uniref:hypothetical protein n=1 Tax=Polluticoccus soli TaxID=3034150 RepID=UPI0023E14748|nr:hypothetical protein [Flavipsychrobacter sp. JY13-12]
MKHKLLGLLQQLSTEKYVKFIAWAIVVFVAIMRHYAFPFSEPAYGDEPPYVNEVVFLARNGAYWSLQQGTSFLFTSLIYLISKLLAVGYLMGARILSVVFFFLSAYALSVCLSLFRDMHYTARYFTLTTFAAFGSLWIWKALPDMGCMFFLLLGFRALFSQRRSAPAIAAILVFCAAIIKPVALFALPGIAAVLLFRNRATQAATPRFVKAVLFTLIFTVCFSVYHIPGYQRYNQLMLEDKWHSYVGTQRFQVTPTWREFNVFFEAYKQVHHKENKWALAFEEVAEFKKSHPQVVLELSYLEYAKTHTMIWWSNIAERLFLEIPFMVEEGFFFFKFTSINNYVGNLVAIEIIAALLFAAIMWSERSFIRKNILLFAPPAIYTIILTVYLIPQLEGNWFVWVLPFLALPIARALCRRVNILLLFALQTGYLVMTYGA